MHLCLSFRDNFTNNDIYDSIKEHFISINNLVQKKKILSSRIKEI